MLKGILCRNNCVKDKTLPYLIFLTISPTTYQFKSFIWTFFSHFKKFHPFLWLNKNFCGTNYVWSCKQNCFATVFQSHVVWLLNFLKCKPALQNYFITKNKHWFVTNLRKTYESCIAFRCFALRLNWQICSHSFKTNFCIKMLQPWSLRNLEIC